MTTKWACVGPGNIAFDFFLSIRENLPTLEHEFVAVASREISRAESFAEKFSFKRAYGAYNAIAEDPEVDTVYIATAPTDNHAPLSIQMLEAGKHVLCEKPMAVTAAEARTVFEAARKNKKVFMEGMWSRFSPAYERIRQELSAGNLGQIQLLQTAQCFNLPDYPVIGGGGMHLFGIYLASLATMIFKGMPEKVTAEATMSKNDDRDVGGCVILKYKNGGMANMVYHLDACNTSNHIHVFGTKGTIKVPTDMNFPSHITTPTGSYEYPEKGGNYNFVLSAGLYREAKAMRETIQSGKLENELCSFEDSEISMRIVDEVRKQIGLTYPGYD